MQFPLVQPLYRARISRECTQISLKALYGAALNWRYWPAGTVLCVFCNEKGFTCLYSSCPLLLDNMHLAIVQPLHRARISRECIHLKAIYGAAGNGDIRRPVQVCSPFAPRKCLNF